MKNKNKPRVIFVCCSIAALLIGCGGGGGSTSTSPTPPVSNNPNPPAAPVLAANLQTATPASYPAGGIAAAEFDAINKARAAVGVGPLVQSQNIDLATAAHKAYVEMNQSGADAHHEVAGAPGFTGVNPIDRIKAAGYAAVSAGEVIGFGSSDFDPIVGLLSTVYHRQVLLYESFTHVGIAAYEDVTPTYIDAAYIKPQNNAGDFVGVYPANGQTGVPLVHRMESPNPFYLEMEMTVQNMCTKTSYPVSLQSQGSTTLTVTTFTVTEQGQGTALDARIITHNTSEQDKVYLPANVAYFVGKAPFKPNTKYTARFVGTATGTAVGGNGTLNIDKSWSFTTGTTPGMTCNF